MADVRNNLESQVRQALNSGEISIEVARRLTGMSDHGLSDRDRKLLQLLQDAINNGHVRCLTKHQSSRIG